jgi:glycosyltransferase involved in cell wall biosynthesis
MKVLFDFEDRVNRFWGVPLATIDDVYSMLTSDIEIDAWISPKEKQLINSLKELPANYNSLLDKINLDVSRPRNLNLWLFQFIKVFDSSEYNYLYVDHFPKTSFKNSKRIIRIHDPFSNFKNPLKEFFTNNSIKNKVARAVRSSAFQLAQSKSIIVCNTKFTAKRISQIYDIPSEKLHVVPYGFNFNLVSNSEPEFKSDLQDEYYLMICGLRGNKRPDIVINCWAKLSNKLPNLIVVGTVPLSALSDSAIKQIQLGRLVLKSKVTEHDLNRLRINANAMIFVSNYEGFGRPVIEALISGVPSIANDLEVFKEIDPGCVDFFSLRQLEGLVHLLEKYNTKVSSIVSKNLINKSKIYSYEEVGKIWKTLLSSK